MKLRLKPGQSTIVAGKWWGVCNRCHNLVRIDKPVIGSLHICSNRVVAADGAPQEGDGDDD